MYFLLSLWKRDLHWIGSCPIPLTPFCCHKIIQAALYKKRPVLIGWVLQSTLSTVKMRSKAQKMMLGFCRTAPGRLLRVPLGGGGLQRDSSLVSPGETAKGPASSTGTLAPVLVVGTGCVLAPSWQRSRADRFLGACDCGWMQLTHLCCINAC